MITLFHCLTARSFRPLWVLEEMGLDYELRMLPFPPRSRAREFLEENPLGTVPLFVDSNVRMTESVAICQFLAESYGGYNLLIARHEDDYGSFLNWLYYGEATLTFPQTLVFRYGRLEPQERRQPQVVLDYSRWFAGRLKLLDSALRGGRYLCGGRLTIADVSVGYALMLAEQLGLSEHFPARVGEYWRLLSELASYKRAVAVQTEAGKSRGISISPFAMSP